MLETDSRNSVRHLLRSIRDGLAHSSADPAALVDALRAIDGDRLSTPDELRTRAPALLANRAMIRRIAGVMNRQQASREFQRQFARQCQKSAPSRILPLVDQPL